MCHPRVIHKHLVFVGENLDDDYRHTQVQVESVIGTPPILLEVKVYSLPTSLPSPREVRGNYEEHV